MGVRTRVRLIFAVSNTHTPCQRCAGGGSIFREAYNFIPAFIPVGFRSSPEIVRKYSGACKKKSENSGGSDFIPDGPEFAIRDIPHIPA